MTRKVIAIALLVAVFWVGGTLLASVISTRIHLDSEIDDLRSQFLSLHARRQDLEALEQRLAAVTASPALRHAALLTDSDRSAIATLQRSVRDNVQSANGNLLSLSEVKGVGAQTLGLLMRARIHESAIPKLMAAFETGEPRLTLSALSLVAKTATGGHEADIELTATIHALWLRPDRTTP